MINPLLNSSDVAIPEEQDLLSSLIEEQIQGYGVDVTYIVRQDIDPDLILNESSGMMDTQNSFVIEMYIEDVSMFNGDGDVFSKFGISVTDQCTFLVSVRRFKDESSYVLGGCRKIFEPVVGDIIFSPINNAIWQIRHVKKDRNFFRFGKNYTWRLECSLYTHSYEHNTNPEGMALHDFSDSDLSVGLIKDFGQGLIDGDYNLETEGEDITEETFFNPDPIPEKEQLQVCDSTSSNPYDKINDDKDNNLKDKDLKDKGVTSIKTRTYPSIDCSSVIKRIK